MNMLTMEMNPGYFNRYVYTFNDPMNNIDPSGEDVLAVTVDVDQFSSSGGGASVGVYTQFEYRLPNLNSIIDGITDNPGNIGAAVFDAITDTTEVGTIVSGKGGFGSDSSAGGEITYGLDNASDLAGASLSVEGGVGPYSVGTSIPVTESDNGSGNLQSGNLQSPGPRSFTAEIAFAAPGPSGSVAAEYTVVTPIRTQER